MLKRNSITVLFILILCISIVCPLIMLLIRCFFIDGQVELSPFIHNITKNKNVSAAVNTLILGMLVIITTAIIATPIAFIMVKTQFRKYKWLEVIILIPFMTPPYIGSMGWIYFIQPNGLIAQIFPSLNKLSELFFSLLGLVLIMSLHLFPFLYLIIKKALNKISATLEDASYCHGATKKRTFFKVIMPLLITSYAAGLLLVFVKTISEFGTPATFGRRIGFNVLTTTIHHNISQWPINMQSAISLSLILLSMAMSLWAVQEVIIKKNTYALVGAKAKQAKTYEVTSWTKLFCIIYMGLLFSLSILIPYLSIFVQSILKIRGDGLHLSNLSLIHYEQLFSKNAYGLNALLTSLGLAVAVSLINIIIGMIAASIIVNKKGNHRLKSILNIICILPNTIPNIVFAIGFILLYNNPWFPIHIYNTYGILLVAYCLLFLPTTVQYIKNGYLQIDTKLIECAQVFNGSSIKTLTKIIIPMLMPSIISSFAMTFIISIRELVVTLLLIPTGMVTISTYIYQEFEQGNAADGMTLAFVTVMFTIFCLLIVNKFSRNNAV